MKKGLFIAAFAISALTVSAQKKEEAKVKFAAGVSFSLPTGDAKEFLKAAPGIEAQATLPVATNLEAFAQAGVQFYTGKTVGPIKFSNQTHVPLMVGARYNSKLILGAGIGYGIWSGSGNSNSNGFLYSPQAGYDFGKIEALANYTSTSVSGGNLSAVGVKVFYKF